MEKLLIFIETLLVHLSVPRDPPDEEITVVACVAIISANSISILFAYVVSELIL